MIFIIVQIQMWALLPSQKLKIEFWKFLVLLFLDLLKIP
jgi:hypothetical protein